MKNEKLVNCTLYGGTFGNKHYPYELREVYCTNCDNCPLYKKKECLIANRLAYANCPYGRINERKGASYRTKSYFKLKDEYDNLPSSLKSLKECKHLFGEIGDYYFLNPYYVDIIYNKTRDKIEVDRYGHSLKECEEFLFNGLSLYTTKIAIFKKHLLTEEFLKQLFSCEATTFLDNVPIKAYQEKVIPSINLDLFNILPDMAKKLGIEQVNHIGLMARLNTLKDDIEVKLEVNRYKNIKGFYSKGFISIKAEDVIDDKFSTPSWSTFIGEPLDEVKFKVADKVYVKVLDEEWITPNTIFKGGIN